MATRTKHQKGHGSKAVGQHQKVHHHASSQLCHIHETRRETRHDTCGSWTIAKSIKKKYTVMSTGFGIDTALLRDNVRLTQIDSQLCHLTYFKLMKSRLTYKRQLQNDERLFGNRIQHTAVWADRVEQWCSDCRILRVKS